MRDLLDGIMLAAEHHGEDGWGRDGLVGYFRRMLIKSPADAIPIIVRLLKSNIPLKQHTTELLTKDELYKALCERLGENAAKRAVEHLRKFPTKRNPKCEREEKARRQSESTTLANAVLLAMEQVGEDGYGHEGIRGCLSRLLVKCPRSYQRQLLRVAVPLDSARAAHRTTHAKPRTLEEIDEDMRRRGLPPFRIYPLEFHDQE
jgi:hypothetical protein